MRNKVNTKSIAKNIVSDTKKPVVVKEMISKEDVDMLVSRLYRELTFVYIIADIAEGRATNVISITNKLGVYRFNNKQKIDKLKLLAKEIREELTSGCNVEESAIFGEVSDMIKTQFEEIIDDCIDRKIIIS